MAARDGQIPRDDDVSVVVAPDDDRRAAGDLMNGGETAETGGRKRHRRRHAGGNAHLDLSPAISPAQRQGQDLARSDQELRNLPPVPVAAEAGTRAPEEPPVDAAFQGRVMARYRSRLNDDIVFRVTAKPHEPLITEPELASLDSDDQLEEPLAHLSRIHR